MTSLLQASFTGGELSPSLWGRVDIARYLTSLKGLKNFVVQPYGGAKNRSGFRFCGYAKSASKRCRMIPFEFSSSQSYALEFGDYVMRVWKSGAQVLLDAAPSAYVAGTSYGMGEHVSSAGVNYYSLQAQNLGNTPASSPLWWYPLEGSICEIPTPYSVADIASIQFTQDADVMTLVHPGFYPRQLTRFGHSKWTLTQFANTGGPFQDINVDSGKSVCASGTTGIVTLKSSAPIFSAVNVGQMFYLEQSNFSQPWEVDKDVAAGDIRRSDGKYYRAEAAGRTGTLRPINWDGSWNDGGVTWQYLNPGWGIGIITEYVSGTECKLNVSDRLPDSVSDYLESSLTTITSGLESPNHKTRLTCPSHGLSGSRTGLVYFESNSGASWSITCLLTVVDPDTVDADIDWFISRIYFVIIGFKSGYIKFFGTYKWAFGAWGGDQGFPCSVGYHQQRQVFGGTTQAPLSEWMSRTGAYTDFSVLSPIQDDDAISFKLASGKVDPIRGMASLDKLIVLTDGSSWVVGADLGEAITPTQSIPARRISYRGAASIAPIGVGSSVLFVQAKGKVVRDLGYEGVSSPVAGADLTVMSSHLLEGHPVEEWVYQQTPFQTVWMVRGDGVLLSMTYVKEQEVIGWARHETDGVVESVCCISEGDENALYMSIKRSIGGTDYRYIERMANRMVLDVRDAFFVDSGLTYDGTNTTSTTVTVSGGTAWDETETLNLSASTGIFSYPATTDIGDAIVFMDPNTQDVYRLTITGTSSASAATATMNTALPEGYRNTARSDWAFAHNTMTGLGHLEGKVVAILNDGNEEVQQQVVGGLISLTVPGVKVHVGLPYNSDMETLDVVVQGDDSGITKKKIITSVSVMVQESRGIEAGKDFDSLYSEGARSEERYDQPASLRTGLVNIPITTNWSQSGRVCIRQSHPLPLTILAIIPEVNHGSV